MTETTLRVATEADFTHLQNIYIDAVRSLGPQAYSTNGVAAWLRWPTEEPGEFRARVFAGHTWIAEVDAEPAAFAEFTPPDHLDFLYTRGEFARRGLATRLHEHLEIIAREEGARLLRTEASYLSRPAFSKFGYETIEAETVQRFGETFRRFKMRKLLRAGAPATGELAPCRADYTAAFKRPPRVSIDATVLFDHHDHNHPGWFSGGTADGTIGFFPAAWFEIDKRRAEARALRDYDARELTVKTGDLVGVIEVVASWARVMTAEGELGWLPAATAPATDG